MADQLQEPDWAKIENDLRVEIAELRGQLAKTPTRMDSAMYTLAIFAILAAIIGAGVVLFVDRQDARMRLEIQEQFTERDRRQAQEIADLLGQIKGQPSEKLQDDR